MLLHEILKQKSHHKKQHAQIWLKRATTHLLRIYNLKNIIQMITNRKKFIYKENHTDK